MNRGSVALAALVITACAVPAVAATKTHRASARRHGSGVTQRKRLHVNDVITTPGCVEIDWGLLYSLTSDFLTAPSALKFTPNGNSLFWGRTEYSVSFDSVASEVTSGQRASHFSDRLTYAATTVIYDSEKFDVAISPQVTQFLRNDSGVRIGGTAIARSDVGLNSLGASLAWTGATNVTDTNPAGVWDFIAGYGRQLGERGLPSRITLHLTTQMEKATGFERNWSAFAGAEYQFNPHFALDLTGQRFGLSGGYSDTQIILSLTWTLGKIN